MNQDDIMQDNVGIMRLERALGSMYHESGSDDNIRVWYNRQKDFWGGVQAAKKLLWPFAAGIGPLEGLYRTGDLRVVCKQLMGPKASLSRPQLAVALTEMGFIVMFKDQEKFNTNFPSKKAYIQLKDGLS